MSYYEAARSLARLSPARAEALLEALDGLAPVSDMTLSIQNPGSSAGSFKPSIAVIIGVLTTMFSLTFLLLLYAKHCKRSPNVGPEENFVPPQAFSFSDSGIDPAIVEALPMFSFGSLQGMKDGLECAVCLCKFEDVDILRLLPKCKHAFHVECVDTWLISHSTCPLCRYCISAEDSVELDAVDTVVHVHGVVHETTAGPRISDSQGWQLPTERLSSDRASFGRFLLHSGIEGVTSSSLRLEMNGRKDGLLLGIEGFSDPVAGLLVGNVSNTADASSPNDGQHSAAARKVFAQSPEIGRRLGHRIIIADVVLQHRWSDFVPSDTLFVNKQTLLTEDEKARVSLSRLDSMRMTSPSVSRGEQSVGSQSTRKKGVSGGSPRNIGIRSKIQESIYQDLEMGSQWSRPVGGKPLKSVKHECETMPPENVLMGAATVSGLDSAADDILSSRLLPYQRSMSEITGYQRVAHVRRASGDLLLTAPSSDGSETNEQSRKWSSIARRTLKWLIGRERKVLQSDSPYFLGKKIPSH